MITHQSAAHAAGLHGALEVCAFAQVSEILQTRRQVLWHNRFMLIPTVIEHSRQAGATQSYDLYSKLFKERVLFLGDSEGEMTVDSANILIASLLYLDSIEPDKGINLYINSPGGLVTAGLAVYDTMQYIKAPVTTICVGMAMSFGAVLLAAGTKGKRFALTHARIMIHQPLTSGVSGQATDIEIEAKEILQNKQELSGILAHHTGQPLERILRDAERNFYLSAEEAKAYGLIDAVISRPPK
jgi:ATP-dependent Clp protease, protease subunit